MTHDEVVDIVRFLFPDKSLLFQDEKALQVEEKFTSTNSAMVPCRHFFYQNSGTTVVRCVHCGEQFPFEAQHQYRNRCTQ